MQSAYALDRIVESLPVHFAVSRGEVKSSKGLYRNMTVYLVKKQTGVNNTKIGDLFGGLSYSAVSKVNTRFSDKLKTDKKLRMDARKIIEHLSYVKA